MTGVPQKALSVFDSTCILVGIIIGAGIFETAPTVTACMGSGLAMLGIWLLGGLFALFGSFCYGELATTYPSEGGDFVYLGRAYGKWAGFLFGWSQLLIIRPGDIATIAFIFARYASQLYSFSACYLTYTVVSILLFTCINILGVKEGKWIQNVLTLIKAAGLMSILIVALFAPDKNTSIEKTLQPTLQGFELALILVLFTYGGWNEVGYVAAELKNPSRNIIRSLVYAITSVTILYILVNMAFFVMLGYDAMAGSQAVTVDALEKVFHSGAGKIISILICISSLGAVNGLIFTGGRISYAVGTEHRLFQKLGAWSPRFGTPVFALLLQGIISCTIVLLAGSFINTILYTAPLVWLFFLATTCSVFILRKKDLLRPRPYKACGFPVTTILFCLVCLFMLYSCITFAYHNRPMGMLVMGILFLSGIAFYPLVLHFDKAKHLAR